MDLIQGQETGNVEYIIQAEAGELAANPVDALEILYHWLDGNQALLKSEPLPRGSWANRPPRSILPSRLSRQRPRAPTRWTGN